MNPFPYEIAQEIMRIKGRTPYGVREAQEWVDRYYGHPEQIGFQVHDDVVDELLMDFDPPFLPERKPIPPKAPEPNSSLPGWGTWG